MIFRDQFPDNSWLKSQVETDFKECREYYDLDNCGWPTVLINSTDVQTGVSGIKGPLSIFFNNAGKSSITIDNSKTTIHNTSFVIANQGQIFDIEIPRQTANDSVVLSIGDRLLQEASYYLRQQDRTLLDNPGEVDTCLPGFNFGSVYRDRNFDVRVANIRTALQLPVACKQLKEEAIFNFVAFLFQLLHVELHRKDQLKSVKHVTRSEVLNRLRTAVELIHAQYELNLSLHDLASASCLSKFHFLRVFKEAYGITPSQYIQKVRVDKAIDLLRNTALPIQEIAEHVGLENGNSLTRLVSRRTSFPPTWHREN